MQGTPPIQEMIASFSEHVSLLLLFLNRRVRIIDDIEQRLLNVQGKAAARNRNRADVERIFSACFFEVEGLPRALSQLKGQLASAHVADGFEPVTLEHRSYQLDAVELIFRAYDHWDRHRWPGRNARLVFAQTLYCVHLLHHLEQLTLRIWDQGNDQAGERLRDVQSLLDRLNATAGAHILVRDARWLIQTAQGPLTRLLQPYFKIAALISSSLSDADRLEVHKAGAKLTGGHLRSQLRYRAGESGRAAADPEVLAITRNSNSMDAALLVGDLVPLLAAYKVARETDDSDPARRTTDPGSRIPALVSRDGLADAIIQGLSADPELFLMRHDILGACTMIEEVFIERGDDGVVRYTPAGAAHLDRLRYYRALIAELAGPLSEHAGTLADRAGVYSPLAIAYGFCADILTNMATDALQPTSTFDLSLEDIFTTGGESESTLARARGWQRSHERTGGRDHFEYSQDWAEQVRDQTATALSARLTHADALNASTLPDSRLFVVPESVDAPSSPAMAIPEGAVSAQEHCVTSDLQRALATGATAFPKSQILLDRKEGRFLASVEIDGKWFGVSKVLLTACTSRGTHALITGVPQPVIDVLRLTCRDLLVVVSR